MEKLTVGLALCGSYCTYSKMMAAAERLCEVYRVVPILSEHAASTDSRFGRAQEFREKLEQFSGDMVVDTIAAAEPIGPKKLLDALVIAPCTGNTLAKLAAGIADTSVTLAAKAHLRNNRPVIVAVSTNDGLSGNAANIGTLLNRKQYYFVPFTQDDPIGKPASLVADFTKIEETVEAAMRGVQIQPILL